MSMYGWGVGDIMAISRLAIKVYAAYKDAPDEYRHISDEVESLRIIIHKAARHFEGSGLDDNSKQEGQKVLKGCQNVLEDLNSLIEKYKGLVSANNTSQVFRRVKLGTEDIATLRSRLATNAILLNSFIQSCEFLEIQARLTDVLGLHRTSSRVSIDSVASFAGSVNTKNSFKRLCKDLYDIGVTAEVINQKKEEILNIFKAQNTTPSGQIDGSSIVDNRQSLVQNLKRPRFGWIWPIGVFGPSMIAAAEAGDTKRLISTLKYIQNIDFKDDSKETATALHKAAAKGHKDIVQVLLVNGASIEAEDSSNKTPLHLAAWNGHTVTVELLLGKGASIEAIDEFNETPLHLAARSGHTIMGQLLLEKGASIEALNKYNNTPLHLAALEGRINMVDLFLQKGALIEARGNNTQTPLHLASRKGHTDTVRLLLEKGALIETRGDLDQTSLHHASLEGYTNTVNLLLEQGALIEVTDKDGSTPLHLSAWKGHKNVVELLLVKGASIEARSHNLTPQDMAAEAGHTDIVQLLKNKDAELVTHGNRVGT